jgi:hypothetical protein
MMSLSISASAVGLLVCGLRACGLSTYSGGKETGPVRPAPPNQNHFCSTNLKELHKSRSNYADIHYSRPVLQNIHRS